MKVLGIRFCTVTPDAEELAEFLGNKLGIGENTIAAEDFGGAVFTAGDSWIEMWKPADGMPQGIMLQIVVDDADAFAEHARTQGLDPQGPNDFHGERIYFLTAPGGLAMSFQSQHSVAD